MWLLRCLLVFLLVLYISFVKKGTINKRKERKEFNKALLICYTSIQIPEYSIYRPNKENIKKKDA